jgi:RNA polymerase sigma-70 factor (ECF subfamily)
MQSESLEHRLSLIPTLWSLVYRAHDGPADGVNPARRQLLERYGGAIQRYLRKVIRDPDGADEVFQEFAVQVLHGDLRGANPQRGRFRNFVKGTLFHMIADYRKDKHKWPGPLPDHGNALSARTEEMEFDKHFVESWCDELLAHAWAALDELAAKTDQPFYAVLRFRADHPEMRAPELAEQLGARLNMPFTAVGIRQILHRAREKFAALLLDEVIQSLENPTLDQLTEELIELGLFEYCQPALERSGIKVKV